MGNHTNFKGVVGRDVSLLSPMIVEKRFPVEVDELPSQAPKRVIGRSLDSDMRASRKLRQVPHTQRQFAHNIEAASSAPFQCPKQIRICTRIGNAYLAVGGDNLRFE